MEYCKAEIEFLDIWVKKKDGGLTGLYTKPTDKHMYVQVKSNHPTNVKKVGDSIKTDMQY